MSVPRWLWGILVVALLWSWNLYFIGWLLTPKGQRYFWVTFDVSDYNAHLRWARQAFDGKNKFVNLYTTEPHLARTFNLHDWFIGKLSRWFSISLHLSLRLVHTIGVIVFVLSAWWLARPLLTDVQQKTYMIMLCFLGGIIWSAEIFGRTLVGMPEANTFIALATMPWFVWGKALSALLIGSVIRVGTEDIKLKTIWTIMLGVTAGIFLGNIHPYALAPVGYGMVLWFASVFFLSRKSNYQADSFMPRCFIAVAIILPAFATASWQALTILWDPIYRSEFQFPLETPPIWLLIANYGVVGLIAFLAVLSIIRRSLTVINRSPIINRQWLLLSCWLIGGFLAVYLTPTMQQRKLIEGSHLPMCILSAWAWHELILPRTIVVRKNMWLVLFLLCGATPLTFCVSQLKNFQYNDDIALHYGGVPFYLSERHLMLIDWLAKNTDRDEAILCNYQLGNYIPVLIGRKVFIGHWAGTYCVQAKLRNGIKIWRGEMDINEAKKLFQKHRLKYALATIYERHATKRNHKPEECLQFSEKFHLDHYGEIVYHLGDDAIYRLRW